MKNIGEEDGGSSDWEWDYYYDEEDTELQRLSPTGETTAATTRYTIYSIYKVLAQCLLLLFENFCFRASSPFPCDEMMTNSVWPTNPMNYYNYNGSRRGTQGKIYPPKNEEPKLEIKQETTAAPTPMVWEEVITVDEDTEKKSPLHIAEATERVQSAMNLTPIGMLTILTFYILHNWQFFSFYLKRKSLWL